MIDHASINAHYRSLSPEAKVHPIIVLHPNGGSIEFYHRTAHLSGGQRFAAACALRRAMNKAVTDPIMGGDVWIRRCFLEVGQ